MASAAAIVTLSLLLGLAAIAIVLLILMPRRGNMGPGGQRHNTPKQQPAPSGKRKISGTVAGTPPSQWAVQCHVNAGVVSYPVCMGEQDCLAGTGNQLSQPLVYC